MKKGCKVLQVTLGILVFTVGFSSPCEAQSYESYEKKAGTIAADVLVYRPAGVILTVGGAALFLIALPISAIAGGTKKTAHTLVATPFNFTFRRPMGTDLRDYVETSYAEDRTEADPSAGEPGMK